MSLSKEANKNKEFFWCNRLIKYLLTATFLHLISDSCFKTNLFTDNNEKAASAADMQNFYVLSWCFGSPAELCLVKTLEIGVENKGNQATAWLRDCVGWWHTISVFMYSNLTVNEQKQLPAKVCFLLDVHPKGFPLLFSHHARTVYYLDDGERQARISDEIKLGCMKVSIMQQPWMSCVYYLI